MLHWLVHFITGSKIRRYILYVNQDGGDSHGGGHILLGSKSRTTKFSFLEHTSGTQPISTPKFTERTRLPFKTADQYYTVSVLLESRKVKLH
jgi:hypothetical protein